MTVKGKLVKIMKYYAALKPLIVYTQNGTTVPKGEKPGFGQAVFIVSPTKEEGYNVLTQDFLKYRKALYKHCLIDFLYKEKVGYKKVSKNNAGTFKKDFKTLELPASVRMVTNGNKASVLKQKANLLVNLGEWMNLFFQFQLRSSVEKVCHGFFDFLNKRINSLEMRDYNKVVYIDMDQWINSNTKLALDRSHLTNPISIFIVSAMKYPELFESIKNISFLVVSSKMNKVIKFNGSDLLPDKKANVARFKQRLLSMVHKQSLDENHISDEVVNLEEDGQQSDSIDIPIDKMSTDELVDKINAGDQYLNRQKIEEKERVKKQIMSDLTRNLTGRSEDTTSEFEDEDDLREENENPSQIEADDEKIEEICNIANQYMDNHPEVLEMDPIEASNRVKSQVKKKYYIHSYQPKYTDKQLKEMQKLAGIQKEIIGDVEASFEDLESKIIETSDFSNVVTTSNPNIQESKFVNFEKSYNQKKLQKDIDHAVSHLSTASSKVFIVDKKEEDTSTPLDLKKTLTYVLKDENGKKMTLKFDVPIIFDDHFMYIHGNKKIIQNQVILKPIVKTGENAVQIVGNYKKMFISRHGDQDIKVLSLIRYLQKNVEEFNVIGGNGYAVNKDYKRTLEYDTVAKKIIAFQIGSDLFILNIPKVLERLDQLHIKYSKIDLDENLIVGIDTEKKKPIVLPTTESFCDLVLDKLPSDSMEVVKKLGGKMNARKSISYSQVTVLQKASPLILILLYFEGFKTVMEKAGIEYELIPKDENPPDIDLYEWGLIELEDGYIKWKRYPTENSLLMNGLNKLPMDLYSIEELESKDTYTYLLTHIYSWANQSFNLDQFYDFMIDPITKEILSDMHLPTDLVSLCLLANKMLKTNECAPESNFRNVRLRGNECVAYHVYNAIANAYGVYRKTLHRGNVTPITVKQDIVLKRLLKQPASVMNTYSALNPVQEVSRLHDVSYKGEIGMNMEKAFNLGVRAYNETMLGIAGITTSPDSGVGIKRQLTLEPNVTSTRGYLDIAGKENVNDLTCAQLCTPSELLTPLGVQHDDPTRTSMAYKQSISMVLVDDSDPVLIGNGVEKVLPYHISSEFTVVAEDDGIVVEKKEGYVVVKYKNGKYRSIDTSVKLRKNADGGFFIPTSLRCDKEVGDKVTKNEVIAWDDKAFAKQGGTKDASLRLGPLIKVAIIPEWDIYEDSAPISYKAAKRMVTDMCMPVTVVLNKDCYVSQIAKVGDKIEAGQSVIRYDNYHDDPDVMNYIEGLREDMREDVIESNSTTKKSHYTGTVVDIQITSTIELNEMSESLRKIVSDYWKKLKKRNRVLDQYKNADDSNFYKSGNLITDSPEPVQTDYLGKVKGEKVDEGVIITFYIAFKDMMSRGDKMAAEFALKAVDSHVIQKGMEPYPINHPDDPIDMIVAPLSISARKTPSIFLAMFGNKILIEMKKRMREWWDNN